MAAAGGNAAAALAALKQYWGFHAFRHAQAEVIEAVLAGRDSLCVMATGSGKSLWCARLAAAFGRRCARGSRCAALRLYDAQCR